MTHDLDTPGRRGRIRFSAAMKPVVDRDACAGHGRCTALCPEVFDLDDDGIAEVVATVIPAERFDDVEAARLACPEQAITTVGSR